MTSVVDERYGITMVIFDLYSRRVYHCLWSLNIENSQVKCILMFLSSYTVNDRGVKFDEATNESVGGWDFS